MSRLTPRFLDFMERFAGSFHRAPWERQSPAAAAFLLTRTPGDQCQFSRAEILAQIIRTRGWYRAEYPLNEQSLVEAAIFDLYCNRLTSQRPTWQRWSIGAVELLRKTLLLVLFTILTLASLFLFLADRVRNAAE